MNTKHQNQQNPPPKKSKWMDEKGNIRLNGAVKTGSSTTIIAKNVTENGFRTAWSKFEETIKNHGGIVLVSTATFK